MLVAGWTTAALAALFFVQMITVAVWAGVLHHRRHLYVHESKGVASVAINADAGGADATDMPLLTAPLPEAANVRLNPLRAAP